MRAVVGVVLVVGVALLAGLAILWHPRWLLGPTAGNDGTAERAETIALAIAWPRRESAYGLARAVIATDLGRTGGVTVLEATDLYGETSQDPLARLVIAFRGTDSCYELVFDHYGTVEPPLGVPCPDKGFLVPPPVPDLAQPAFARTLEQVLPTLPATPTEDEVRERLKRRDLITPLRVDGDIPAPEPERPAVEVLVDGTDVAVSFHRHVPGRAAECLLGSRVDGKVAVWRPSRGRCRPVA